MGASLGAVRLASGVGTPTVHPRLRCSLPRSEVTRIYLIRHGETTWNRHGLYQGTADVPLSRAGALQAAALARALSGVRFGAACSSPLSRARATAEAVVGAPGPPVVAIPELREISYGLWQGRGPAARARCAAGLERRWRESPWSVRFPGGETLREVSDRAVGALERILRSHPGETVLLSGHGHLNRVLLIHALGWDEGRFWSIEQPNACCYLLRFSGADALSGERLHLDEAPS